MSAVLERDRKRQRKAKRLRGIEPLDAGTSLANGSSAWPAWASPPPRRHSAGIASRSLRALAPPWSLGRRWIKVWRASFRTAQGRA